MLSVNLRLTQFKREIELVTPNTTLAKPFLTILGSSAKISSNHKKTINSEIVVTDTNL